MLNLRSDIEHENELTAEELAELDQAPRRFPLPVQFVELTYRYYKRKRMYVPVDQFDEGTTRIVEKYHRKRRGAWRIDMRMEDYVPNRRYVEPAHPSAHGVGANCVYFRGIEQLPEGRELNTMYEVPWHD